MDPGRAAGTKPVGRIATDAAPRLAACQGWTDGTQIVLPSVPEPLDDNLEKCLIGYLDHEMAHVAFSDFGVAEEFMKKHPGFEGMLNVVEDALIERRAMEPWPGVRHNLELMFRQIWGRVAQLIQQPLLFVRLQTKTTQQTTAKMTPA